MSRFRFSNVSSEARNWLALVVAVVVLFVGDNVFERATGVSLLSWLMPHPIAVATPAPSTPAAVAVIPAAIPPTVAPVRAVASTPRQPTPVPSPTAIANWPPANSPASGGGATGRGRSVPLWGAVRWAISSSATFPKAAGYGSIG